MYLLPTLHTALVHGFLGKFGCCTHMVLDKGDLLVREHLNTLDDAIAPESFANIGLKSHSFLWNGRVQKYSLIFWREGSGRGGGGYE